MSALWSDAEAANATHGKATAPFAASGVSIDSRTLQKGDLFVALKGPNHDGHDHVRAAFAAGAAAAMVAHTPVDAPAHAPLLAVRDTQHGLEALGRAARARSRARVAAVTGSVGKTSTKEALRAALDAGGKPHRPTHASAASFNNAIGVPLTLARLPADADYAVFEIGMNHAREISPLARMVHPDVAVVTTVEAVHTENFPDGIDGVAAAKAEIFDGFNAGARAGIAVLNRDNKFFDFLAQKARSHGVRQVLGFGEHQDADYRLVDFAPEAQGSRVTAKVRDREISYRIGAPGRHWAINSLAVLATAEMFGVAAADAATALADMTPPKGRGQRHQIVLATGAIELIDESYNASPASMRAAFEVLKLAAPGAGGRRIAVLGDMLELGDTAAALHASLAEPLLAAGADLVFACGPNMQRLYDALPAGKRGAHAPSSDALIPMLAHALRAGDVVTVKGSFGSRMGKVVDALLAGARGRPSARIA